MLRTAAHTLPGAVGLLQPRGGYQRRRTERRHQNCLQYISTHLHEELRLEELAHECGAAQPQQYRDNPHGAYESQEGGGRWPVTGDFTASI